MNISGLSGIVKALAALGAGGVLAGAVALGATNNGGTSPPPAAQVVEETPTSVVEETATTGATSEPAATSVSGESPPPRKDCRDGWLAYDDPDGRFSFCYPAEFRLSTDSRSDPRSFGVLAGVYPLQQEEEGFAVWFQWVAIAHTDLPVASVCASGGGKYSHISGLNPHARF